MLVALSVKWLDGQIRDTESCWEWQPHVEVGLSAVHLLPAAVLAARALEVAASMSEKAVAAVPGLPALQYTLKHYLLYLGRVQERATALSQGAICWRPERASRTLVRVMCRVIQQGRVTGAPEPQTPSAPPQAVPQAVDSSPCGDSTVDLGCRAEAVP